VMQRFCRKLPTAISVSNQPIWAPNSYRHHLTEEDINCWKHFQKEKLLNLPKHCLIIFSGNLISSPLNVQARLWKQRCWQWQN
jgi:hypothetical protein